MSGVWLPAKLVEEAARVSLRQRVARWKEERENSIQLRMERGRFSFLRLRQVSLTRDEAEAENNTYVEIRDAFIGDPTLSERYLVTLKLCIMASDAQDMIPGAQVYVSSEDHGLIHDGLRKTYPIWKEHYDDNPRDPVFDNGNHIQ